MRIKRALTLVGFVGIASVPTAVGADGARDGLLIRNVGVVLPERGAVSEPTDVLVRGGRITAIGSALSPGDLRDEEILDGTGRFLAPGLIDGHTHLDSIPGMTEEQERAHPEIAREARAQIPRSYLYFGFTTVVDLSSGSGPIARWNEREVRPRAYFCGGAPVADGYPMRFLPAPLRYRAVPGFILDDARPVELPDDVDPADHTPEAVVARMKADGATCVKTHWESGFGGGGDWTTPSVGVVRRLVAAAHEEGLPVLLHANSQEAQAFGLEAGVDAFAHGLWTWKDRSATALNEEVSGILAEAVERGVGWQPTVQVLYGERDLHDPAFLSRPDLRQALPPSLLDWYAAEEGQWYRREMGALPWVARQLDGGTWRDLDAEPIARVSAALAYMAAHGGRLLFGSDTPSDLTFANPPGLNGRWEMSRWAEAGVSPPVLLRAATVETARFFGLEGEIGTVEVGKRADLLLLAEDPTRSVDAWDSIEVVVLDGRAIPRATLSATGGP